MLLPQGMRARHRSHRDAYRAEPVARAMGTGLELVAHRRDGDEFHVDVSLSPVPGSRDEVLAVVRDITERHTEEARLGYLAAIVESCNDAVYSQDRDGMITGWNPAAHALFGYEADEVMGWRSSRLIAEERWADHELVLRRVLGGEVHGQVETEIRTKDGLDVAAVLTVSAIRDAHDRVIGASVIARDVTEQKLAAEAVRDAYERERAAAAGLRAADQLKDEFLATVSHELRTPLTTILGFAALLHDPSDPTSVPYLVERIERNARDMRGMVERLLDFSRLTAGAVNILSEPVGLDDLVAGILEDCAELLADQRVKFSPGAGLGRVLADGEATRHIVGNLLSNAAKFSPPEGLIEVSTAIEGSFGVVGVADEGGGIPADLSERIFERFFRAADQPPGKRGAGVGLAIARRYAEMQGGRIWCDAATGPGALFRFTLPLASRGPDRR
jgi:PAS domain S-box-containing protein